MWRKLHKMLPITGFKLRNLECRRQPLCHLERQTTAHVKPFLFSPKVVESGCSCGCCSRHVRERREVRVGLALNVPLNKRKIIGKRISCRTRKQKKAVAQQCDQWTSKICHHTSTTEHWTFCHEHIVWPDLVKLCLFATMLKHFGHFESVHLVFGKKIANFGAIGQVLMV